MKDHNRQQRRRAQLDAQAAARAAEMKKPTGKSAYATRGQRREERERTERAKGTEETGREDVPRHSLFAAGVSFTPYGGRWPASSNPRY